MIFVFDTSIITYGAILFCIFSYNYFTLTWPMPDRRIQIAKIRESIGLNDKILGMPTQDVEVNYIKPEKFFPSRYSINCSFHDG
jgi:hypothetical protein